jgi:hypothetical protein
MSEQSSNPLIIHLDLIREAIATGNMEELDLYLDRLDLSEIDIDTLNQILAYLLTVCYEVEKFKYDNGITTPDFTALRRVIQEWSDTNPSEDQLPTTTQIFILKELDITVLRFVALSDGDSSFYGHMMHLMMYPSGPDVTRACQHLHDIYGEQSIPMYIALRDELDNIRNTDGETNDAVYDFLTDLIKEYSTYAPIPDHISLGEYTFLPRHEDLVAALPSAPTSPKIDNPTTQQFMSVVLKASQITTIRHAVVSDILRRKMEEIEEWAQKASAEEKSDIMRSLTKSLAEKMMQKDPFIFRVLGPAHPMYGTNDLDTDSPAPCAKWGGCRMLTCTEYANVTADGEIAYPEVNINLNYDDIEWFTGNCDICNNRIRSKEEAVRMPMEEGGWDGCYCSWDHARSDVVKPNETIMQLIDIFEKQCKEHGIQKRIWDQTFVPDTTITSGISLLETISNYQLSEEFTLEYGGRSEDSGFNPWETMVSTIDDPSLLPEMV